jgi:Mlc titration factor MtfA (ptsG expression regulator)
VWLGSQIFTIELKVLAMWSTLTRLGRRTALKGRDIAPSIWAQAIDDLAMLDGLTGTERDRLRALALSFLQTKTLEPVGDDAEPPPELLAALALQACLPVLELGLDWYSGFRAVILYPGDFAAEREHIDDSGIVHVVRDELAGEAWDEGPVVLSRSALRDGVAEPGYNLVIHELAHKLDLQNGVANGMPPLHGDMRPSDWSATFSEAFEALRTQLDRGEPTDLDPYAATDPAEFFAVTSEYFFTAPQSLESVYPGVYRLLSAFYRQDPLSRLGPPRSEHV